MRKSPLLGRPFGSPKFSPFGASFVGKPPTAALPIGWATDTLDFANFTFTVSDTVATSTSASLKLVGSKKLILTQVPTGKYYAEIKIEFPATNVRYGLYDIADETSQNNIYIAQTGLFTISNGDVCAVAIDANTEGAWFRNVTNNTIWNTAGADPATGVGGFTTYNHTGQPMQLALVGNSESLGSKFTLSVGPTFVGAKPVGFSDWVDAP